MLFQLETWPLAPNLKGNILVSEVTKRMFGIYVKFYIY